MDGESSRAANKRSTHQWTPDEDAILIDCCIDLVNQGGWSKDNGTFKAGYLTQLEKWMAEKIPNCTIKGVPHINSRMRLLKSQYREMADMLSNAASGFGWDDEKKCVTCELDVWVGWVKGHPGAAGLRNKPFPHFDKLALIFGKDRATGLAAESPADAVENIEIENANGGGLEDMNVEVEMDGNDGFFRPSSPSVGTQLPPFNIDVNTTRANRNKKRRAIDAHVEELTGAVINTMGNFHNLYEKATQQIGKLVACFQYLSDDVTRRAKVMDLIDELKGDIEDMTDEEIVEVTEIILSCQTKVDVFFSCSFERRKVYVKKYLRQVRQL